MYAVIQSGGKQYRVQPGEIIQIEKLEGDVGSAVKFDQILMVGKPSGEQSQIWLGKPLLSGAGVEGEIVGQGRGEKVLIIKMKRRKGYRRTQGHRQSHTQVLVTSLGNGAGESLKLADDQKKTILSKFYTQLSPRGLAHTPKTLGSRKRMAAEKAAGGKSTEKKATPKAAAKPAAKKTTAKAKSAST